MDSDRTPAQVTVFACGPSKQGCVCRCPDSCGHDWNGPARESDDGRGSSAICSKCGIEAMAHDVWVLP